MSRSNTLTLRTVTVLMLVATVGCASGESSTPSPAPSSSGSSGSPATGTECEDVGAQTGMEDGTLVCTVSGTGLEWHVMQVGGSSSAGSGSGSGANPDQRPDGAQTSARVGESCATAGDFGFGDGMVTVCDAGRYRYALPDDIPATPAGGYTSRPDWYPTLAELFGPHVDVCTNGPITFTRPIIQSDQLSRSMPAGMMIGDHVTPIDHMYIGIASLDQDAATRTTENAALVTAPAAGTIIEVSSLGSPESHRIVMVHGCGIVSVYMVVNMLSGVLAPYADQVETDRSVQLDLAVNAGDEIGRQMNNPLDFNIFDGSTWLTGFANPYSYAQGEAWKPYTADPFPMFTPEIRTPLEASIQRTTEPRWGVIDHDVTGTAAGSWFLDGTMGYNGITVAAAAAATSSLLGGVVDGKNTYAYGHLSLAQHPVDPSSWIVSTGWWQDPNGDPRQGVIRLADGQPAPDALTAADGAVVYELASPSITQPTGFTRSDTDNSPDGIGYTVALGPTLGWAVVQVIDDRSIAIELVADPATEPTEFSAAKRGYHR